MFVPSLGVFSRARNRSFRRVLPRFRRVFRMPTFLRVRAFKRMAPAIGLVIAGCTSPNATQSTAVETLRANGGRMGAGAPGGDLRFVTNIYADSLRNEQKQAKK